MKEIQPSKAIEKERYEKILDFMAKPEIADVLEQNHEGLEQYFKFYVGLGK